jgi:hypothetical protein
MSDVEAVLRIAGFSDAQVSQAVQALRGVDAGWLARHPEIPAGWVSDSQDAVEIVRTAAEAYMARRPGLGDYVHNALGAIGITPDRVAAALGVDDCGCEGRREWLNEAGRAFGIGSPPELTGGADSPQS